MSNSEYIYEAFITYNQNPKDTRVARDVQFRLEHYRIPSDIQKLTGIKKFKKIFRDTTELSGTNNLTKEIETALISSRYLIVICSQRTKKSTWVPKEIEMFLKYHDEEHILTVLVDGEPDDVIPEQLRRTIQRRGADGSLVIEKTEPLACDYRKRKRFQPTRREEIPRIAARFLNCSYDDLYKREQRYRRKRSLILLSVIGSMAFAFICYLLWSNSEIKRNYRESVRQRLKYAALSVKDELDNGRRIKALNTSVSAIEGLSDEELLLGPELLNLMEEGSRIYDSGYDGAFDDITNVFAFSVDDTFNTWATDKEGKYLTAVDDSNNMYIWSCTKGNLIYKNKLDNFPSRLFVANDMAIVSYNEQVACIDCVTGDVLWNQVYDGIIQNVYESSPNNIRILTSKATYDIDKCSAGIVDKIDFIDIMDDKIMSKEDYESFSLQYSASSENGRWMIAEINAKTELDVYEGDIYTVLIDLDNLEISYIDEQYIQPEHDDGYIYYYISNNGDLICEELADGTKTTRLFRVDPIKGVLWEHMEDDIISSDLKISYDGVSLDPHQAKIYFQYDDENMDSGKIYVETGNNITVLGTNKGEEIAHITTSSDIISISPENNDFLIFMSGKIGYQNRGGGVTEIEFPAKEYEKVISIDSDISWNHNRIFFFDDSKTINVYAKSDNGKDLIEYDSIPEGMYLSEHFLIDDGLVCIYIDENNSETLIKKYGIGDDKLYWETQVASPLQVAGYINGKLYLIDEYFASESNGEITEIDALSGKVSTYNLLRFNKERSIHDKSDLELTGISDRYIVYTMSDYSVSEGNCSIYLYDPEKKETLSYSINNIVGSACVMSDHEIAFLTNKHELYRFDLNSGDCVQIDTHFADSVYSPEIKGKRINDKLFAVWLYDSSDNREVRVYSNEGIFRYSINEKASVVAMDTIDNSLYILFNNSVLNRYADDGSIISSLNLGSESMSGEANICKNSEGNIVISGDNGVYVIDTTYNTIRTKAPCAIEYDVDNEVFYMDIRDSNNSKRSCGYIRRKTPHEIVETVKEIIGQ